MLALLTHSLGQRRPEAARYVHPAPEGASSGSYPPTKNLRMIRAIVNPGMLIGDGQHGGGSATSGVSLPRFGENFFDEDGFGLGVGFSVGAIHDGKIPLEALVALRFVGMGSEIVSER